MENSIINKISTIIITEKAKNENLMALSEFIELMNNINDELALKCKNFIKKANTKLSNNLNFFNYEIKSIDISKVITIMINHELKTKEIKISKNPFEIHGDLKNSDLFLKIIADELDELIAFYNDFNYLNSIMIKCKYEDINIVINQHFVEIFMHKSPNWITMGKAFSLKYDIIKKSFNYELDLIDLEKNIKDQEKLLFSKIFFEKNLLPNELQVKNEYFINHKLELTQKNFFSKLMSKIKLIIKKR